MTETCTKIEIISVKAITGLTLPLQGAQSVINGGNKIDKYCHKLPPAPYL